MAVDTTVRNTRSDSAPVRQAPQNKPREQPELPPRPQDRVQLQPAESERTDRDGATRAVIDAVESQRTAPSEPPRNGRARGGDGALTGPTSPPSDKPSTGWPRPQPKPDAPPDRTPVELATQMGETPEGAKAQKKVQELVKRGDADTLEELRKIGRTANPRSPLAIDTAKLLQGLPPEKLTAEDRKFIEATQKAEKDGKLAPPTLEADFQRSRKASGLNPMSERDLRTLRNNVGGLVDVAGIRDGSNMKLVSTPEQLKKGVLTFEGPGGEKVGVWDSNGYHVSIERPNVVSLAQPYRENGSNGDIFKIHEADTRRRIQELEMSRPR